MNHEINRIKPKQQLKSTTEIETEKLLRELVVASQNGTELDSSEFYIINASIDLTGDDDDDKGNDDKDDDGHTSRSKELIESDILFRVLDDNEFYDLRFEDEKATKKNNKNKTKTTSTRKEKEEEGEEEEEIRHITPSKKSKPNSSASISFSTPKSTKSTKNQSKLSKSPLTKSSRGIDETNDLMEIDSNNNNDDDDDDCVIIEIEELNDIIKQGLGGDDDNDHQEINRNRNQNQIRKQEKLEKQQQQIQQEGIQDEQTEDEKTEDEKTEDEQIQGEQNQDWLNLQRQIEQDIEQQNQRRRQGVINDEADGEPYLGRHADAALNFDSDKGKDGLMMAISTNPNQIRTAADIKIVAPPQYHHVWPKKFIKDFTFSSEIFRSALVSHPSDDGQKKSFPSMQASAWAPYARILIDFLCDRASKRIQRNDISIIELEKWKNGKIDMSNVTHVLSSYRCVIGQLLRFYLCFFHENDRVDLRAFERKIDREQIHQIINNNGLNEKDQSNLNKIPEEERICKISKKLIDIPVLLSPGLIKSYLEFLNQIYKNSKTRMNSAKIITEIAQWYLNNSETTANTAKLISKTIETLKSFRASNRKLDLVARIKRLSYDELVIHKKRIPINQMSQVMERFIKGMENMTKMINTRLDEANSVRGRDLRNPWPYCFEYQKYLQFALLFFCGGQRLQVVASMRVDSIQINEATNEYYFSPQATEKKVRMTKLYIPSILDPFIDLWIKRIRPQYAPPELDSLWINFHRSGPMSHASVGRYIPITSLSITKNQYRLTALAWRHTIASLVTHHRISGISTFQNFKEDVVKVMNNSVQVFDSHYNDIEDEHCSRYVLSNILSYVVPNAIGNRSNLKTVTHIHGVPNVINGSPVFDITFGDRTRIHVPSRLLSSYRIDEFVAVALNDFLRLNPKAISDHFAKYQKALPVSGPSISDMYNLIDRKSTNNHRRMLRNDYDDDDDDYQSDNNNISGDDDDDDDDGHDRGNGNRSRTRTLNNKTNDQTKSNKRNKKTQSPLKTPSKRHKKKEYERMSWDSWKDKRLIKIIMIEIMFDKSRNSKGIDQAKDYKVNWDQISAIWNNPFEGLSSLSDIPRVDSQQLKNRWNILSGDYKNRTGSSLKEAIYKNGVYLFDNCEIGKDNKIIDTIMNDQQTDFSAQLYGEADQHGTISSYQPPDINEQPPVFNHILSLNPIDDDSNNGHSSLMQGPVTVNRGSICSSSRFTTPSPIADASTFNSFKFKKDFNLLSFAKSINSRLIKDIINEANSIHNANCHMSQRPHPSVHGPYYANRKFDPTDSIDWILSQSDTLGVNPVDGMLSSSWKLGIYNANEVASIMRFLLNCHAVVDLHDLKSLKSSGFVPNCFIAPEAHPPIRFLYINEPYPISDPKTKSIIELSESIALKFHTNRIKAFIRLKMPQSESQSFGASAPSQSPPSVFLSSSPNPSPGIHSTDHRSIQTPGKNQLPATNPNTPSKSTSSKSPDKQALPKLPKNSNLSNSPNKTTFSKPPDNPTVSKSPNKSTLDNSSSSNTKE